MFMDMIRPNDLSGGGAFKPSDAPEVCEAVMAACAARGLPRLVRRALTGLKDSLDEAERRELSPSLYTIAIKSCGAKVIFCMYSIIETFFYLNLLRSNVPTFFHFNLLRCRCPCSHFLLYLIHETSCPT